MSIINDALKKAQKKFELQGKKSDIKDVTKTEPSDKPAQQSKAAASPKTDSIKRKKAWHKTLSALIPLFFLIAGIFIATIAFLMHRSSETSDERNYRPKPKSNKPLAQGAIELNGISYIENNHVALINNEIYEEGDTVGQYKVYSIESTMVILKDEDGEIITLSVR